MTRIKKLSCIILSFIILVCSLSVVSLITVFAESVTMGRVKGTSVTVRQGASRNTAKVGSVSTPWNVEILESTTGDDGKTWYKVSYMSPLSYGKVVTGYIHGDYLIPTTYNIDPSFANQLSAFPPSYRNALIVLKAMYPNWNFVADHAALPFEAAVAAQDYKFTKLVQDPPNSWASMRYGCFDWDTSEFVKTDNGTWYGASRELIAYYMDPRNFLNANDIFQYIQHTQDSFVVNEETKTKIETILDGTFMDSTIDDPNDPYNGRRYADVILDAANESHVIPYILASTIKQEQGKDGTSLSSGYTYNDRKVYNYFNYGASGNNKDQVIKNGAAFAYNSGWFTRSDSIFGGAKNFKNGYIDKNQNTYFYKNFNVLQPEATHQFAQNVQDSISTSRNLLKVYIDDKVTQLTFRIPVYDSMPDTPCVAPEKSDNYNNYFISDIFAYGLTPSFSRYTFSGYGLTVGGDTTISVSLPNGAKLLGETSYSLAKGNTALHLTVQSQTGYTNTYTIDVTANVPCTVSIATNNGNATSSSVICGDTNSDGTVTITDLANVRLHLLGLIGLSGNNIIGADTNRDGEITITDLANIRLHLLGLITLT